MILICCISWGVLHAQAVGETTVEASPVVTVAAAWHAQGQPFILCYWSFEKCWGEDSSSCFFFQPANMLVSGFWRRKAWSDSRDAGWELCPSPCAIMEGRTSHSQTPRPTSDKSGANGCQNMTKPSMDEWWKWGYEKPTGGCNKQATKTHIATVAPVGPFPTELNVPRATVREEAEDPAQDSSACMCWYTVRPFLYLYVQWATLVIIGGGNYHGAELIAYQLLSTVRPRNYSCMFSLIRFAN